MKGDEYNGVEKTIKTIKDLGRKRNMLAHGTPLEMTQVQEKIIL